MSIKDIFSNSIDSAGINEYDKSTLMQIPTVPGQVYHVLCRGSSETKRLSQQQKGFSQFFSAFLKSSLSFKYFETKCDPHRFCILEIRDSENAIR